MKFIEMIWGSLRLNYTNIFNIISIIFIAYIIYLIDKLIIIDSIKLREYSYVFKSTQRGLLNKYKKTIFFVKLSSSIDEIKRYSSGIRILNSNLFCPYTLIIFSFVLSFLVYFLFISITNIFSISILLALISFFIPYNFLNIYVTIKKSKLQKHFINYLINLKNYTQTKNDILDALKRAQTSIPLKKFIDRFNISVEKGLSIYDAFERLKGDININRINEFITNIQFCHLYGGDFTKLIEKYIEIFTRVNLQIEKEKQESYSTKLVLIILIIVNIYILFSFILQNEEYRDIITKTTAGVIILNFNILSYLIIYTLIIRINKMEE